MVDKLDEIMAQIPAGYSWISAIYSNGMPCVKVCKHMNTSTADLKAHTFYGRGLTYADALEDAIRQI